MRRAGVGSEVTKSVVEESAEYGGSSSWVECERIDVVRVGRKRGSGGNRQRFFGKSTRGAGVGVGG